MPLCASAVPIHSARNLAYVGIAGYRQTVVADSVGPVGPSFEEFPFVVDNPASRNHFAVIIHPIGINVSEKRQGLRIWRRPLLIPFVYKLTCHLFVVLSWLGIMCLLLLAVRTLRIRCLWRTFAVAKIDRGLPLLSRVKSPITIAS